MVNLEKMEIWQITIFTKFSNFTAPKKLILLYLRYLQSQMGLGGYRF